MRMYVLMAFMSISRLLAMTLLIFNDPDACVRDKDAFYLIYLVYIIYILLIIFFSKCKWRSIILQCHRSLDLKSYFQIRNVNFKNGRNKTFFINKYVENILDITRLHITPIPPSMGLGSFEIDWPGQ